MPTTGTDATLLKAFIKQCKKITSNFDEGALTQLLPIMKSYLCDDNNPNQYDIRKFKPSSEYYDILFAFNVIAALKNTNKIYNSFMVNYSKLDNSTTKKKKPKVPSNWKIIKGGKK